VGLSGPTCTGKSTIGGVLAEWPGATLVPEPDASARLKQMLVERSVEAVDIEDWIVRERHRRIREAIKSAPPDEILIIDRVPAEDRDIFFQLHYQIGAIDGVNLARLNKLFATLAADTIEPDLIVFLSADEETIRSRLAFRSEGEWLREHLPLQLALYRVYRTGLEVSQRHLLFADTSGGLDQIFECARDCRRGIMATRLLLRGHTK
jgi:thymidylate kinase